LPRRNRDGPQRHDVRVEEIPGATATEFRCISRVERDGCLRVTSSQPREEAIVIDRNIDVHVRAIRKKLGEQRQLIETIRAGYRFKD
jgi:DNA-binding response OmpR family regulator